jgi:hypothetical protein
VAAIIKAKHVSGRSESSDNDIYWHTREAGAEIAKTHKIPWQYVITLLRSFENRFMSDVIERLAEPIWPQIGHPDIIVEEVMNS